MTKKENYISDQEEFWAGEFGTDYIVRNKGNKILASNLIFFSKALSQAGNLENCIEFGADVGMNLRALKLLYPNIKIDAIEINKNAVDELKKLGGGVYFGSISDYIPKDTFDLVLIKTVLIHINPEYLKLVYQKLYDSTNRYILLCEYYNPTPVAVTYRGHEERLFKRDFAGEMLDIFSDLSLVDYGFCYHRDEAFPQDDINWFLLKRE